MPVYSLSSRLSAKRKGYYHEHEVIETDVDYTKRKSLEGGETSMNSSSSNIEDPSGSYLVTVELRSGYNGLLDFDPRFQNAGRQEDNKLISCIACLLPGSNPDPIRVDSDPEKESVGHVTKRHMIRVR
ncbi:hypothetical protein YC2023_043969 [Brassica napus]